MLLSSGAPWHLECDVERVGDDHVCRIHCGERQTGAVAESLWKADRAATRCLTCSDARQRAVAVHAAHLLCRAGRRRVFCIAGLHLDSLDAVAVEQVVQAAYALARRAARELERRRIEEALDLPGGTFSRIRSVAAELRGEVETFMNLSLEKAVRVARSRVAAAMADYFGDRIRIYAPLYLSSACSNDCAYCGFRRSARFERTRLTVEDAQHEARHLAAAGHRTIDLVTGEIATDPFVDYVGRVTRAILADTDIRRINLNLGALSAEQYRRLSAAGASGYNLYQETYARRTYFEIHGDGPKHDMAYRLEAPHRAAATGFGSIGMGILLGLHPIREDLAALIGHARILLRDFPAQRIGFSLPRLRRVDADCDFLPSATVDDDELIKAMLLLRIQFPEADLAITTREKPGLRDRLISLGVTKISAGVSTAPGGYTLDDGRGTVQFHISDARAVPEIADTIRRAGRRATYE